MMDPRKLSPTQSLQLDFLRTHGRPNSCNNNNKKEQGQVSAVGLSGQCCQYCSAPKPRLNPDLALMMGLKIEAPVPSPVPVPILRPPPPPPFFRYALKHI